MPTLVVLGIAQDGGHPQAGCRRPCCAGAWADPRQGHRVASLGLVSGGRRWLVDASPDLPRQLHELDAAAGAGSGERIGLDGVLLTHAHTGHYTGLVHLGREAMGARGVPVWAMPGMTRFLRGNGPWSQLVDLGNVALSPLGDGAEVELDEELTATPFVVPHRAEWSETVGFVLRGPRAAALYLPDVDRWDRDGVPLADLLAPVDVAYLDATFFDGRELPGARLDEVPHPFVVDTLERLARLPARESAKVRLIHLNHTNPLLDPDSAASATVRAAGVGVAREGETVEL